MKQELMVPYGEIRYRSWLHEALTLNGFIALIRLGINFIQTYLYQGWALFYLHHIKRIKDLRR